MKTIPAGEFKAHCLELMNVVQNTHEEITITKHGRPVARLVPIPLETSKAIYGYMQNRLKIIGDIVAPLDEPWHADE